MISPGLEESTVWLSTLIWLLRCNFPQDHAARRTINLDNTREISRFRTRMRRFCLHSSVPFGLQTRAVPGNWLAAHENNRRCKLLRRLRRKGSMYGK